MTVGEIYNFLDEIAPFSYQDKSDNSGLLVGDSTIEVKKILVCLDVTNEVVTEAVGKGVNLIIAHHPQMYRPISRIPGKDPLHALIRNNISLIAAHTNLDIAVGGIADLMLKKLGFPESSTSVLPMNPDGKGYGRIVDLDTPVSTGELVRKCKEAFGCTVVRYVDSGKAISKVGVSSGRSNESVDAALYAGCDAFICGEVIHEKMLFAADYGLTLIEVGHFHSEDIYCEDLVDRLKSRFKGLEVEKASNSADVCKYLFS